MSIVVTQCTIKNKHVRFFEKKLDLTLGTIINMNMMKVGIVVVVVV